jgi:predicted lipid-binding transport protein (Tim44 family)
VSERSLPALPGRRGSRSHSMPVQPERPVVLAESQPSRPIIPTPPAHQASRLVWTPVSGRTWLVTIAGLIAGGVLLRLLFGTISEQGGGAGVAGLVLVGAAVVFAVRRVLHRRAEPRSMAAVADTPPPRKEPASLPPTDFERGIQAIRRADRGFQPAAFAGYAGMTFRDVEGARVAREAVPLRDRLTPEMYAELGASCDRLRTAGRSVRVDEVDVGAEVTEAWQDGEQDYVTACVAGTILGHTLDDATGSVVSGSRTKPSAVTAFLTFTRPAGLNLWRLSIIQEPSTTPSRHSENAGVIVT